ncbi:hypothetical protein CBS147332_7105 [Penicillium roqueforti]|nr:hypothetical protein CBS147332_7105 [Penicillium roqueforti]KAI3101134.1 hypothetical protein CBS147331_8157 [Penicillium roqueforti]
MKRPVDLGHCDFELSPLRLHFSATAYFTEAATGTGPSLGHTTISFSQWIDLRTLWVSQAPQLELRLFVSFDPMIKAAEPAFATELVREIGLPEPENCLVQKSLELLRCGLRKLFLSGAPPSHDLRPLGNGRLHKVPSLAPAVFEPRYCEGMEQRAVSLAPITTSLLSMLESHETLQQMLVMRLIRPTDRDGYVTPESAYGDTPASKATDHLGCLIKATLWKIAQHQLARLKTRKTAMPFFRLPIELPEPSIHPDDDDDMPPLLLSEEEFDSEDSEDRGDGDDANGDDDDDGL